MMSRRLDVLAVVLCALVAVAAPAAADEVFPYSVASGDPRPDSVILWTYLASPLEVTPKTVTVEVATDDAFADVVYSRQVEVDEERYGGAVKVRVAGLAPYTTYYYRFGHAGWQSRTGRTRTAPSPDMDVEVKFAVVYCQDYIDRYYNAFAKLLRDYDDDIDFVVHLGDYIYETTGGSDDTDPSTARTIQFEDVEGALQIGTAANPRYAAASLANYRTIYKTYRSDPAFQQVHERWPMIVIWDDHEFSNDHWGATATYTNGRRDEFEPDRRRNAEQAFFEWAPIEIGVGDDGTLDVDAGVLYPNSKIYRDFRFGSTVHLVMTDSRTHRPDHLIPEDAFPGAIAVPEERLIEALQFVGIDDFELVRSSFDPYVDMDRLGGAQGFPILKHTATLIAAGAMIQEDPSLDLVSAILKARDAVGGLQSATFINLLFGAAGYPPPFSSEVLAQLPRGISYLIMGKTGMFSSTGSRTQVIHDTFNLYAIDRYVQTGGAAQDVYGGEQNAWLFGTVLTSSARWRVLGNSVMMTPLVVDFTNPLIAAMLPPGFPDVFRTRLITNNEDFNGFPQKRLELVGLLDVVPNSVVISGDIHATFVTDHGGGVFEFTPPSVSSGTFGAAVAGAVAGDPNLGQIPGLDLLLSQLGLLLQVSSFDDVNVSPSDIVYANTDAHGFGIFEATAESLRVLMYEIPAEHVRTDYSDDPAALDALFTVLPFTLSNGELTIGK